MLVSLMLLLLLSLERDVFLWYDDDGVGPLGLVLWYAKWAPYLHMYLMRHIKSDNRSGMSSVVINMIIEVCIFQT